MIRAALLEVPGAMELIGRGIYTALPDELPATLANGHAVVAGDPPAGAAAALRLCGHGCSVTLVVHADARRAGIAPEVRAALRGRADVSVRFGMELTWAAGIERLEALVLRHVASGRIEVCNADALFVVSNNPGGEPA
ncbi:MAG TPA: hypothetical protein VFG91_00190 [Woeseiaceae bacterium]|nr:hypothetical protein [Woeseiaceae bacterium]